ncbi:hypothetical protein BC835DRAFT_1280911, partial [Cytidiella melzeri]
DGGMDAKLCCSILSESLLGTLGDQNLTCQQIIFQQDTEIKHTPEPTTAWFKEHKITVSMLPWAPNSPDMNILKNILDHMGCKLNCLTILSSYYLARA